MKKIGSLFMVSVLALAGIGVSFAGFSDAISVYGTVDTATVDIVVEDWYSGTWVWKVWMDVGIPPQPYEDEIYIYNGWVGSEPDEDDVLTTTGADYAELQSFSKAMVGTTQLPDGSGTYDIDMVYDNLFPCIDFEADFIIHYVGSIPAKINVAEIFPLAGGDPYPQTNINFLEWLWAYNTGNTGYGAWVEAYRCYPEVDTDETTIIGWTIDENQPVDVGYQLHNCNYVYVKLVIHLPQDNLLQGLTGTFGGTVSVIQWYDCD